MWAHERHRRILSMLETRQRLSAAELARLLDVSRETVRRDLVALEQAGQVRRVHGGVVLPGPAVEPPFRQRMRARLREKREKEALPRYPRVGADPAGSVHTGGRRNHHFGLRA